MSAVQATGLGEPDLTGKRALFRPPKTNQDRPKMTNAKRTEPAKRKPKNNKRVRTSQKNPRRLRATIELTPEAYLVVQTFQNQYRLRTGKSLPIWKALSEIIEFFGKSKGIEP